MRGSVSAGLAIFAVLIAFGGGLLVGANGISRTAMPAFAGSLFANERPPEGVDLTPVWRAWHIINDKYVATQGTSTEPISDQEKVWGMVQGLAASLEDPYTVFLPPQENETFQEDISGAFEGVGMEIAIRNNVLTVVSPLKGTPAARAGIEAGDRVIEIDGESTRGIGIDEAVSRIRGPRGTEVVLTIAREGENEPLEIAVVRDVIEIPTINAELRSDGVFVIELLNFSAVSAELFRNALQEFQNSGSDRLVLDLRGNPGGYLGAAVDMASWFLPAGEVVVTEDYGENKRSLVHRSRGYDIFDDGLQMVILVNRGSASASEILAGALGHYDVATLIGTSTFGKGSVQELVNVTSDTALKVTVARWLLPGDEPIPHEGIEPDIVVEVDPEEIEPGEDPQLDRAVEFLLTGE